MQSGCILENDIFKEMVELKECIEERKYWTTFSYVDCLNKIDELINEINYRYLCKYNYTLEQSAKQIFDKTFEGDLRVFIEYFNGILYLTKLHQRVSWHQEYGHFPNND